MVQISPEEVMAQRKLEQLEDEMSEWHRKMLPNGLRIDIPLKKSSIFHIRKIAPLLRQFADLAEKESRRTDLTPFQILTNIWFSGHGLRNQIVEICKPRSKNSDRNNIA
jgi:hypothetical protein